MEAEIGACGAAQREAWTGPGDPVCLSRKSEMYERMRTGQHAALSSHVVLSQKDHSWNHSQACAVARQGSQAPELTGSRCVRPSLSGNPPSLHLTSHSSPNPRVQLRCTAALFLASILRLSFLLYFHLPTAFFIRSLINHPTSRRHPSAHAASSKP